MSELDRDQFEKEWSDAFEEASLPPSEHVWDKIELNIANADNQTNRKRLLFFKLLAAASVAFAAVVGGIQLYDQVFPDYPDSYVASDHELGSKDESQGDQHSEVNLAENNEYDHDGKELTEPDVVTEPESGAIANMHVAADSQEDNGSDRSADVEDGVSGNETISSNRSAINRLSNEQSQPIPGAEAVEDRVDKHSSSLLIADSRVNRTGLNHNLHHGLGIDYLQGIDASLDVVLTQKKVDFNMVPRLDRMLGDMSSKETSTFSNSWAGVSLSAGNYNPNRGSADAASSMSDEQLSVDGSRGSANESPVLTDERPGESFGFGVNYGTRLTRKVVIIGGLSYLEQATSSTSNLVSSEGNRAVASFAEATDFSSVEVTDTYTISNIYTSMSVPMQAGYMLIDNRFGVMLTAGVSHDFFMKKETDGGDATASSVYRSSDEGYQLYAIGGLLGSQLSYHLGSRYSLAVQPQYRQAFTSFTPLNNRPSAFEVSFKFNYIID